MTRRPTRQVATTKRTEKHRGEPVRELVEAAVIAAVDDLQISGQEGAPPMETHPGENRAPARQSEGGRSEVGRGQGGGEQGEALREDASTRNAEMGDPHTRRVQAGDTFSGNTSSGDAPFGDASSGDASSGDAAFGDAASGDIPSGNVPSGNAPFGDAAFGDPRTGDGFTGQVQSGEIRQSGQSAIRVEVNAQIDGWPARSRYDVVLRGQITSAEPADALSIQELRGSGTGRHRVWSGRRATRHHAVRRRCRVSHRISGLSADAGWRGDPHRRSLGSRPFPRRVDLRRRHATGLHG